MGKISTSRQKVDKKKYDSSYDRIFSQEEPKEIDDENRKTNKDT